MVIDSDRVSANQMYRVGLEMLRWLLMEFLPLLAGNDRCAMECAGGIILSVIAF